MDLNLYIKFTKKRIESFYKFHFHKIDNFKYLKYSFMSFFILISFLLILLYDSIIGGVVSFLIALTSYLLFSYRVLYICKKEMSTFDFSDVPYNVLIQNETIYYTHNEYKVSYSIDNIKNLFEIDAFFYIYIKNRKAIIIPKRSIKESYRNELIELFKKQNKYKKYKFFTLDEEEV